MTDKKKEPRKARPKHAQLPWVRLETDTHRDPVLLDLDPAPRLLWYVLLELGGVGRPHGTVRFSDAQLAREAQIDVTDVEMALKKFADEEKIVRKDGAIVVRNFRRHNPPLRFLSKGQRNE